LGSAVDPRVPSALFLGYLVTTIPGVDWLDVGELTSSAWDLGVSHPPGQPLPTLLWRLAMLCPVGSIVYRASVISCICAAAASVPLWFVAELVGRRLPDRLQPLFPPCVCVAALLGVAAWAQAVRPEVYAPQLLLALSVVAAALVCTTGDPPSRGRAAIAVVAFTGLSGATHPLLGVGLLPAAIVGLGYCGRAVLIRASWGLGLAAAATLGLHLYLPLRSAARPELAWGMPHSVEGLTAVLSGRAFAHNFTPADGSLFADNLAIVGKVLGDDLGPGVLALAVVGLALLAGSRRFGVVLALAVAGNLATVLMQNKVFASNPDLHGYLALTTVLLALAAVFAMFRALGWLAARGRERQAALGAWACAVVLAVGALAAGSKVDRSRNHLAENHGRALFDGLSSGSILITSGNSSAFVCSYMQRVERRRPDLAVFHRTLMGHPFFELALRLRHGDPPLGIDTAELRGDARAALTASRPVAVEVREPDLAWAPQLTPSGSVMRLHGSPVSLSPHLPGDRRAMQRWQPDADDGSLQSDADALQVKVYEALLRASYFDLRQRPELMEQELAVVRSYAPGFPLELPRPADPSWWSER